MKKLLITTLLVSPFASSSVMIEPIDIDEDARIIIYCINGKAFASLNRGTLTPLETTQIIGGSKVVIPLVCYEYLENKAKIEKINKE
tara:strand:- start:356 stop:616 length:261 start_codon:yes stop_codon:yes gene_type:complete